MGTGLIIKALSGFYYVDTGEEVVTCRARGKHRHDGLTPLVGDRVTFSPTVPGEGALDSFSPRKNQFKRPAVCNLDQLVLIVSQAIPKTDPFLIDRMTSMAALEHCPVVIVINKWDLCPGEELYQIYKSTGLPTFPTSAETGEGLQALLEQITGKTSAFTGNSGVGKSSLLNAIAPGITLATGEISKKLGRGRHTTRHVELFPLPQGGHVMDTPGFSSFEEDSSALTYQKELPASFPDFRPYLDLCQFQDCSHTKEKGCALLEALAQGKIQPTRHQSYLRLYEKAAQIPQWERQESLKRGETPAPKPRKSLRTKKVEE